MLHTLKSHLEQAQMKMKEQANKKRREVEFKVGDTVYLRIQPYKLKNLAKRQHEKLAPRFHGPYEMLEKIGKVAYKLKLPETARIHPIFHVSQLKKLLLPPTEPQPLPSFLSEDYELQVQPKEVTRVRRLTDVSWQVLIKWKALPECNSTWENMQTIMTQFPHFSLEDKVKLLGGRDDMSKVLVDRVYKRRKPKYRNREQKDEMDHNKRTKGGPRSSNTMEGGSQLLSRVMS